MTLTFIRASLHYLFCIFIVALLSFVGPVPGVHAASITVNDTCSLKNAIIAANTDTATGGLCGGKRRGYHHVDGGRRN